MTESQFYHKDHIERLTNHFLENDWVWLYKKDHYREKDIDYYHVYFCYLAESAKTYTALNSSNCDISQGTRVAVMADMSYRNNINPGFEHLVVIRQLYSPSRGQVIDVRISEEIIYFHNLLEIRKNDGEIIYMKIDNGREYPVCYIKKDSVKILNRILLEYIAAKEMDLVCHCQSEIEYNIDNVTLPFKIKLTKNGAFETVTNKCDSIFSLCIAPHFDIMQSWFNGKFVLSHPSLKSLYKSRNHITDFIIGTNENGDDKYSAEDTNPYTPVFFNKEILGHYANRKNYKIESLRITTPSFMLRCDNDNDSYVVAFLKDIKDLPYKDQCIWKSENIHPDGRLFSSLFINTIIKGRWNGESNSLDFIFRDLFIDLKDKWFKKYNWHIFKQLNNLQESTLDNISLVYVDDATQLENLIKSVALLFQESINDTALEKLAKKEVHFEQKKYNDIEYTSKVEESRINHLSRVCENLNIDASTMIEYMQKLQILRSFILHRMQSKIEKRQKDALNYFSIKEDFSNSKEGSFRIFKLGIDSLQSLIDQLC